MTRIPPKQALIIGAGGQIGADLAVHLDQHDWKVRMVDMRPHDRVAGAATLEQHFSGRAGWPTAQWIQGDATSAALISPLVSNTMPTVVFHLAATLSATGENDPAACWDVNVGSLRVALDALAQLAGRKAIGATPSEPHAPYRPRVLWPSSIAAFGPVPDAPEVLERAGNDAPAMPTSMYGVTKVAGELLGAYYARRMGVDFRSVRFPGLLNATPPGGGTTDYANAMYAAAAEGRESCDIFVGPSTRLPFMYMSDALRALLALAEADESRLTRRVYNVTALSPSAQEIAQSIARHVGRFEARSVPDRRQGIADSWPRELDDAPARADWGWSPEFGDLDRMTAALIRDFREASPRGA